MAESVVSGIWVNINCPDICVIDEAIRVKSKRFGIQGGIVEDGPRKLVETPEW
jgi:hypothetical protein